MARPCSADQATSAQDESPEKLALVQRATTAYLRRALGVGDEDRAQVQAELAGSAESLGRLESASTSH